MLEDGEPTKEVWEMVLSGEKKKKQNVPESVFIPLNCSFHLSPFRLIYVCKLY